MSLAGGGATELKALLEERAEQKLGDIISAIGVMALTGEDDVYIADTKEHFLRHGIPNSAIRPLGIGEGIRDWSLSPSFCFYPHQPDTGAYTPVPEAERYLWPFRTTLTNYIFFGKTKPERGLHWQEWGAVQKDKPVSTPSIAFAFVATHNHFVLDRGGKVFKQSAPIIKLPETATEEDHLALLAYLNSSTACFWMKQVFYPKGGDQMGDGGRLSATSWEDRYEFAGTGMRELPLPRGWRNLAERGAALLEMAQERFECSPEATVRRWLAADSSEPLEPLLADAERRELAVLERMVAAQERLDWECYRLFGLHDERRACGLDENDRHGARMFESMVLKQSPSGHPDLDWFRRAGVENAPTIVSMSEVRSGRHDLVSGEQGKRDIGIVERLDYKRWWRRIDYAGSAAAAALTILLEGAEDLLRGGVEALSVGAIRSRGRGDRKVATAVAVLRSDDALRLLRDHLSTEAVPFLAAHRLTPSGLKKRAAWEKTWELQRREDAGEAVATIPVPPKYTSKDFLSYDLYKLRGKLDVPKERFISYPGCESDEDGEPVYGWAGWDHAQRAEALVGLYQDRKTAEGWGVQRLTPMLAGLLELLPWLKQWHDEPMPDFDTTYFQAYDGFLEGELREYGLTRDDLRAWRPPEKKRGRRKKKS